MPPIARSLATSLPLLLAGLTACASQADSQGPSAASDAVSPYLYVWAGAATEGESDFLAVVDADPFSNSYGEVLSSVIVGVRGGAHHSEHVMGGDHHLFVNSFAAGKTFVIDLSDPMDPSVASSFEAIGEYTYPHTFERLPSGNILATFQTKGEGNEVAGGLVELDPMGSLVRAADAADPADPEIRVYSVTPIPRLNRAVSTTADMNVEAQGTSFQVWRLSDLTLLNTIVLAPGELGYEHRDPAEVRLLSDSVTAMMTTFTCALYRLRGLETDAPSAELVYVLPWADYETDECGIPATYDDIWLQTYASSEGSSLMSFDISDPSNPVLLDELKWGEPWWPHWISIEPGGNRVVLTSGAGATLTKVLIIHLDKDTGELSFDSDFRDPGSDEIGVDFDRMEWPHGPAGPGLPHGAVFSRAG